MNTETITPVQRTAKEVVFTSTRMMTAQEMATEIALKLHGLSGWQGVLSNGVYAPAGLSKLMVKALRKVSKTAMVEEKYLQDDTSAYYPYWK